MIIDKTLINYVRIKHNKTSEIIKISNVIVNGVELIRIILADYTIIWFEEYELIEFTYLLREQKLKRILK